MASPISFNGLSTGIQSDQLISAIMQQASAPLQRMQDKQALNSKRSTLLSSLSVNMLALSTSMEAFNTASIQSQIVTSSDSTGTHVTATATGATVGTYDVQVDQIATKASKSFGSAALTSTVGEGQYAIKDVDGTTKTFTIDSTNNTLSGFKDAINTSGAGVNATIIDTGQVGAGRYQLVVSAKNTGAGSTGLNVFTIAQIGGSNALGIATNGVLTGGNLTSGGSDSAAAQNAHFWLNGVGLTRSSNLVTDAVEGMSFTLKSGGQDQFSTPTTLSVATDKDAITKALQDVVTKYNAVLKVYTDNSQYATSSSTQTPTSTTASNSTNDTLPAAGALANDYSIRNMLSQVRSAIMSPPAGLPGENYYQSAAELGLKTNRDGTLSLDTTALGAALDKNPSAVANVFNQVNQSLQNTVNQITSPGSGNLALIRQGIDTQNASLNLRISSMQANLTLKQTALQRQYASLETMVGQLQAAGQSLGSLK